MESDTADEITSTPAVDVPPTEPEVVESLWAEVQALTVQRARPRELMLTSLFHNPPSPNRGGQSGLVPPPPPPPEPQQKPAADDDDNHDNNNNLDGGESGAATTCVATSQRELVGAEDDALLPSAQEIERVFRQGRDWWARAVNKAAEMPSHSLPTPLTDPSVMLGKVPALPSSLTMKEFLEGHSVWRVSSADDGAGADEDEDDDDDNYGYDDDDDDNDIDNAHRRRALEEEKKGPRKYIRLSEIEAIGCAVSQPPPPPGYRAPIGSSPWLPVFTLAWSYILSARLLELQGREIQYSRHTYLPRRRALSAPGLVTVDPGRTASPRLVRWLSGLLAPGQGYGAANGKSVPPWAAFCDGPAAHFHLSTSGLSVIVESGDSGPDAADAIELLVELCRLVDWGPSSMQQRQEGMSPCVAGFLAALAMPYYRDAGLAPRFYLTDDLRLKTTTPVKKEDEDEKETRVEEENDNDDAEMIRSIVADLPYYMTLSMDTSSAASTIWSMFWHPQIECNLVSPWLSSILGVLKPHLDARNVDVLGRVFSLQREQVAPWWLGLFLLGDNATLLDRVSKYLVSLEEQDGFESTSAPNLTAAVWTGARQSFLDQESVDVAGQGDDGGGMSRMDLLYIRHSYRLRDPCGPVVTWRPFGSVSGNSIEPELRTWIGSTYMRKYDHWVWVRRSGGGSIQRGYRVDKGRRRDSNTNTNNKIHDATTLKLGEALLDESPASWIGLAPSKRATMRMLTWCMTDIEGELHRDKADVSEFEGHPWMEGQQ